MNKNSSDSTALKAYSEVFCASVSPVAPVMAMPSEGRSRTG
ncbi:hypothetical protein [Stenomitos frigidus]|nr:hypothetical protein [Stenomitos frigidus]